MRGKREGAYTPRRGGDEGGDDSSRWLGTYGDAITLLMAFFVMLYAMSEVDAQKFEAFVRGLSDPFDNPAASQGLTGGGSGIVDGADTMPGDTFSDLLDTPLPDADAVPPGPGEPSAELLATDDLAQLEGVHDAVVASLDAAGLGELASFRYDGRGLVLTLATDNVLFTTGSTEISELGRDLVAAVSAPLRAFDNDVFVEGHTDDVPIDRTDYSNWNLSTDRAVAVVDRMITEDGIAPGRIGAAGYGEFRPRVANTDAAARAANRRVDILVVAEGVQING